MPCKQGVETDLGDLSGILAKITPAPPDVDYKTVARAAGPAAHAQRVDGQGRARRGQRTSPPRSTSTPSRCRPPDPPADPTGPDEGEPSHGDAHRRHADRPPPRSADRRRSRSSVGIPLRGTARGERRFRPPVSPTAWTGERDATEFGAGGRAAGVAARPHATARSARTASPQRVDRRDGSTGPSTRARRARHGVVPRRRLHHRLGRHPVVRRRAPGWPGAPWSCHRQLPARTARLPPPRAARAASDARGAANLGLARPGPGPRMGADHIASFGGDPGQRHDLRRERGRHERVDPARAARRRPGLFGRAIAQSGAARRRARRARAASGCARAVLDALGVGPTTSTRSLDLPAEAFIDVPGQASSRRTAPSLALPFRPTVDGTTLPEPPDRGRRRCRGGRRPADRHHVGGDAAVR